MFLFREFTLDIRKEIRAALLQIFGVGWYKSLLLTIKLGLSIPFSLVDIPTFHFSLLFFLLKGSVLSDARLKRFVSSNIKIKVESGSYHGARHAHSLPVHGQRTRTNARTQKAIALYIKQYSNKIS